MRDYLAAPDRKATIKSLAPRGVNQATSLCRAPLALLKQLQPYEIELYDKNPVNLDGVSQDIMYYARLVEIELDRSEWAIIYELDRFHAKVLREDGPLKRTGQGIRKHRELDDWEEIVQESLGTDFLKWAVEAGLVIYVERRLKRRSDFDARTDGACSAFLCVARILPRGRSTSSEYCPRNGSPAAFLWSKSTSAVPLLQHHDLARFYTRL